MGYSPAPRKGPCSVRLILREGPMNTLPCRGSLAGLLALLGPALGAEQEVRFNRDIRPILSNRCFKCHGPDLKKASLDLQSRETALAPRGKRGPAIVAGKAAQSRLIERV